MLKQHGTAVLIKASDQQLLQRARCLQEGSWLDLYLEDIVRAEQVVVTAVLDVQRRRHLVKVK